ncbi:MAG: hypothetical protein HYR56_31800 [Acidobacteria bacterium]|nr:hypothetical protein [Acidobacteriota bacterium]MBI3424278.1 hypothetical protein [Acidobacteriota bacterium]
MPVEMIESLQATQMWLMGALEFLSLLLSGLACAGLLIWFGGVLWLCYCELRRPQNKPPVMQQQRGVFATGTNHRDLFITNHVSERSNSL